MEQRVKLKFLTKHPKLSQLLLNQIGYFGDALYNFKSDSPSNASSMAIEQDKLQLVKTDKPNKIIIVARFHYREKWQTYPAINLNELKSILKLQQQGLGFKSIQRVIENKEQDGFDVKTITFKETLTPIFTENVVLIPETELFLDRFRSKDRLIAELNTPNGTLYWSYSSNKINSAYQKGLLNNINSFVQSVGLPIDNTIEKVSEEGFPTLLIELINNTPINRLVDIASINLTKFSNTRQLHLLYLGPLTVATLFLILSNGYFYLDKSLLKSDIESTQKSTYELLAKKQKIDKIEQNINIINQEFKEIEKTHELWFLISVAISQNMEVTQFERSDKGIVIKGRADKATDILTEFNKTPGVSGATFVGTVNTSRGKDLFSILMQYSPPMSSEQVKEKEIEVNTDEG